MRRSIALLLAAAAIASCAPSSGGAPNGTVSAARGEPRQCFDPARIVNFTRGETNEIYVRALNGDVYNIAGPGCADIGAGVAVSIAPAAGIGSRLCVGDDAQVITPAASFGPARCRARIRAVLTDAEVEALPSRYRP